MVWSLIFLLLSMIARSRPKEIGPCQVAEAFVVAAVIVAFDESANAGLEVTRQIVILQQDAILRVWCQRSILPSVCGWFGAPRT